jgi:hypothetical protein
MDKISSKKACRMAVDLIEEQLNVLPISIAMLSSLPERIDASIRFQRKRRPVKTGSAAAIVAADTGRGAGIDAGTETGTKTGIDAQADARALLAFDIAGAHRALRDNPAQRQRHQRVLVGNALLAVGMFLKEHGIAATRTPEVQFLGHVCNAIVNDDTFRIEAGYVPGASFDGLVIDSSLDGAALFGAGNGEGFMAFGDAIALLQRLAEYLRGTQDFVSGGDAG